MDASTAQSAPSYDDDSDKTVEKAIDELLSQPELEEPPPPYTAHGLVAGHFPPYWNLYRHRGHMTSSDYHIGVHQDEPQFNVNFNGTWKLKTGLTLTRLGQTEPLAEIKSEKIMTRQAIATIPSVDFEGELRCQSNLKTTTYAFTVPVPYGGGASQAERFEWRVTHGKEARKLDTYGWGWKLVRIGPESAAGNSTEASKRDSRPHGVSSDGKEVVAIWVENDSLSGRKYGKFRFLGRGMTGELGEAWAIMTVATICRIYQVEEGEE